MSARLPAWHIHALTGFIGALALLMAFALLPDLHEADLRLVSWLRVGEAPTLHSSVLLVDIPERQDVPQDERIPEFRKRLGSLLMLFAGNAENLPARVALDIWFDSKIGGHGEVIKGIVALQKVRVPVHGALNLLEARDNHQLSLYERMDSVGHNQFVAGPTDPFYHPCLAEGKIALALHLANQAQICDAESPAPRYVHLGLPLESGSRAELLGFDPTCGQLFRRYGGDCLTESPTLRGAIVIIGKLTDDRSPYPKRSGPEMLAWAVNDLIGTPDNARTVLASPVVHLALALTMPLMALGLFGALLRFVRSWRLHPWHIAALAGMLTLTLPIALVLVMRAAGRDYSQVLLPTLLTLLVLTLTAHYRASAVFAEERRRKHQRIHEHAAYDVFVSYRRTHAPWVAQKLLPILQTIQRADGETLSVFWDNRELHSGNYNRQLEISIHESRIFLPLLTPDYFDPEKKYCFWEMSTAWDRVPSGALSIIPFLHQGYNPAIHGHRDFPTLNTAMHGFNTDDAEFDAKLRREILAVLA